MSAEVSAPQLRRNLGRPFVKGQSGNPSGYPKALAEMQGLARQHTPAAIQRLAEIMAGSNHVAAAAAAKELLDRAWGKPKQPIEGAEGGTLVVQIVTGLQRGPGDAT